MRLINIPGARETIAASEYVVHEDVMREKKGKWNTVFEKAQPLYLEVGMGKGRFITELAGRNPENNYVGIEKYSSVLLRALEDNCITRIGATKPISVDVRIITATNKDLTKCISDGTFRADLYYRLNVINLTMIPLRRRREDIKELAEYFLERFAFENGKNIHGISTAATLAMAEYSWPGNVRELRNCMEYSVIVCKSEQIELEDLPNSISRIEQTEAAPNAEQDGSELRMMTDFFTKQRLEMAKKLMAEYKGNKSKVAKEMGVSRSTLYRILNTAENGDDGK